MEVDFTGSLITITSGEGLRKTILDMKWHMISVLFEWSLCYKNYGNLEYLKMLFGMFHFLRMQSFLTYIMTNL